MQGKITESSKTGQVSQFSFLSQKESRVHQDFEIRTLNFLGGNGKKNYILKTVEEMIGVLSGSKIEPQFSVLSFLEQQTV